MRSKESIPHAPYLIESIRSLGYSFETAIADLIDNSISANATKIEMFLIPENNLKLILFDNGCGMNNDELEEALRYGSKNPVEKREETDLGRYGLGMKTASLSQCRKMTVVSKKDNKISSYSWDLDYVIENNGWVLIEYEQEEISKLPMLELFDNKESGTYIMLEKFDRVSSSTANLTNTLNDYINRTIDHIALVFHRFLNNGISVYVNNTLIKPLDPFLTEHKGTTLLRSQQFEINESLITVKPYVLPYIAKLNKEDIAKAGGKEDLKNNQGFYIYRNKRLIIWGTWFRLTRKDELSKLARVMVDIPSELDYMWSIDIKKSSASLPDIIKRNLYNCIEDSVFKSKNIHEYRGRKINDHNTVNHIWERIELREGSCQYQINKDIPQIQLFKETLDKRQINLFDNLLKSIEESFPSTSLYLDVSKGQIKTEKEEVNIETLYRDILSQLKECENLGLDKKILLKSLLESEPYANNSELKNRVKVMLEEKEEVYE